MSFPASLIFKAFICPLVNAVLILYVLNRFGPNTFPAFNSVIYAIEVQVAYLANVLFKPIIDGYANTVEVTHEAEEKFIEDLDVVLGETVFSAGCSNWYINTAGRNAAAWPGLAVTYWQATFFPKWRDFVFSGGSSLWLFKRTGRSFWNLSPIMWLVPLAVATWATKNHHVLPLGFTPLLNKTQAWGM